ncbi:hypothetical protein OOK29_43000 [Streptomyces phaeochromogenes]|uniref:hypothetical protein n=1 Tax=Streptomyces phaeochromogenes TaxID=1923 RepID=UPI0022531CCD|nr:hypothetical protein [Streptomyces phaeochromogenes]MCX5604913.1 hypothetical protein [Streptomyces phaeochromogenes]
MSSDPWGDLAASLVAVHEPFTRDSTIHQGFLPGSPAALECANEPFVDDWATAPSRNANITGMHLANVAMDHLAGLAVLLGTNSPVCIYGPSSMARSAIEVAARCYYLVEPGISPLERIRRHQSARLAGLWEQKKLAETMVSKGRVSVKLQESIEHLDRRMTTITDSAKRHGLAPRVKDKKRLPFLAGPGATRPFSATDLVEDLVGKGNGLGTASYQTLSAVGHGRESGVIQYFTRRGALLDRTHGDVFGTIEASAQQTALNLAAIPLAMFGMLDRLYTHFGWPSQDVGPAAKRLLQVWGRIAEIPIQR